MLQCFPVDLAECQIGMGYAL